ncbi:MAG: SCO family protein [Alphaproteobacteria bacterium HGW-Alphaproteobacteria-7]|jgi:protein SCO1/2|nr:MAG: SCO family protein [Alphaproteobacteria bacterium HGW-Alphaproteobacteria-7]
MQALLASLLVVAAGGGLLWQATDGGQALTAESARRLAVQRAPQPVSPFALETMSGASATIPDARGKVALVEFIYTTCPTLCQSAGADMFRLGNRVREAGLADRVTLMSVSFDPEFDTVERMKSYGERHDADGALWTIARPRPDVLPQILSDFGVIAIPDRMGGYTHNVAVHVVTADGRLAAIHDTGDFEGIIAAARQALR